MKNKRAESKPLPLEKVTVAGQTNNRNAVYPRIAD